MRIPSLFLFASLCSALIGGELPQPVGDQAVFDISDRVVVQNPPNFGANLHPPAMSHWNTEPWHNQWWSAPNPNPITARMKGVASGGSATTLEDAEGGPKIGYYDVFRDGFFDGASIVVYRYEDGKASLIREGIVALYEASKEGPNRITFAEPGEPIQAGDEYVLTTVRTEFPPSTTRTWGGNPWWLLAHYDLAPYPKKLHAEGVRLSLSTDAPVNGGGASLAFHLPEGWSQGPVSVGYWLVSGQREDWPRFNEGKTYTARFWLKQAEGAPAPVTVQAASMGEAQFTPTREWREYSFDFVGAPPEGRSAERFQIELAHSGTLLIDSVTIVEQDGPPAYGFYPAIIDTLRRFEPESLRLWTLHQNRGFGKSLDDALGNPALSNMTFAETKGAHTTDPLGLHYQLMLCQQVGTDPWIITSTMFTGEEQKNLIEYLAGPADSPYGKKRADWGQIAPWTQVFDEIKIEMGNETWNSMFKPQNFNGRAAEYGMYSQYMFEQMESSPWFDDDKFLFVVNGWVAQTGNNKWGYGANALKNAPSAEAVDIAYYTGGWDAVGKIVAESEDASWMNALTYSRRMLQHRADEFKQTADEIVAEQGRPGEIKALVYEAGPGYTLPGPDKFNIEEQREGKSLAHAINSLDIFMSNLRNGYGDQSFFMFKNGHYWASHNREWGEHIAWKALGLRNRHLKGDLITATATEMVTIDLPESKADTISQSNSANKRVKTFPAVDGMPLIDCYPFKDGENYSYMIVSRRLDGPTMVTLNLPYEPEPTCTYHLLAAANPAAHNIDEEAVTVQTGTSEGVSKSFAFQMPPHSVMVIETRKK